MLISARPAAASQHDLLKNRSHRANGVADGTALLTTPFELWSVGQAALGHGAAPLPVQALGGVNVALGIYSNVQGLRTRVSPTEVNTALKDKNGGRDIDPKDAAGLAARITRRAHINAGIGLGNCALTAATIASGNMAAGIAAVAIKVAALAYSGYATAQTVKDVVEVLQKQPAPAPTPAPAPPTSIT